MPAVLIAPKNDAWDFSVGAFIEISVCRCEMQIAQTQLVSQAYAVRRIAIELFGDRHASILGEYLAKQNTRTPTRIVERNKRSGDRCLNVTEAGE